MIQMIRLQEDDSIVCESVENQAQNTLNELTDEGYAIIGMVSPKSDTIVIYYEEKKYLDPTRFGMP